MIIFGQITSIVDKKELKISHGILEIRKNVERFDVTWIPENMNGGNNNCCDYEQIMKMINETYPDCITIYPEGINAVTLIRLLYDTYGNYSLIIREVQRGGEFVEKYASYELILNLKPEVRRKIDAG